MPVVTGFNLTPVKSTALLHPDSIELGIDGVIGDRRFMFVRDDGTRLSGISKAPLLTIESGYDHRRERLTLRFSNGQVVEEDAVARDHARPVKMYDREVTARDVHSAFSEAVRDLIDPTLTLLRVDEPDNAGGTHRVSIVSRGSVAEVGRLGGDAELDTRRFRMLIEIEADHAFDEDAWEGRRVRVGEAVVDVGKRMNRCVMTTLHPDTGVQDFPTLNVLAKHRKVGNELVLGVYGDVASPGMVRLGDVVELAP